MADQLVSAAQAARELRRIAELLPQPVWCSDPQGVPTYANRAWYEYTGLTFEDNSRERWRSAIHPEDVLAVGARWRRCLTTGEALDGEVRCRRHDGAWRWFQLRARPERGADGTILRWIGTCTDIDDRKRIEERHQIAARATKDVVWDRDLVSGAIVWSDALGEQLGFASGARDYDSHWWSSRIHPSDRARVLSALDNVLDANGHEWSAEYRFRLRDGSYATVADRGFLSRDSAGRPLRMVGAMQDVTAWRRAEGGLRLLAEAGGRLAGAPTADEASARLAALVVPAFADWTLVDLVDRGGQIRSGSAVHRDARRGDLLARLSTEYPPTQRPGTVTALHTGQARWAARVSVEELREETVDEGHLAIVIALGMGSFITVPMVARGRCLGVLTLVRGEDAPPYDDQDLRVALELAQRAALSIDNAALLRASRDSEQHLRELVENLPELAWSARPDGFTDYFNRRWYEYTGTTFEQVKGWGWTRVQDPVLLDEVLQRWTQALETGSPFEMECPILGADGTFRWFLSRAIPVRDAEGRVTRWLGTHTDIDTQRRHAADLRRLADERVQVERRLREETERLEILYRFGQKLAGELELETLMQEVTDLATRLSGAQLGAFWYSVAEAGEPRDQLYAVSGVEGPTQAVARLVTSLADHGMVRVADVARDPRYETSAQLGFPEGHPPVKSYLAMPVRSRSGTRLGALILGHAEAGVFSERAEKLVAGLASQVAIAMDNARLFAEARRLITALERSNKDLDQFAYVASHDLKAPLRGISNLAQWIDDDLRVDTPLPTREHLRLLRGRVLRLEAMIDGILRYSRAGREPVPPESIQLGPLVEEVFELLAPPAGAMLRVVGALPTVTTERVLLQQVLLNLTGNAIKHGGQASAQVEVGAEVKENVLTVFVRDHGLGIPREYWPRIWGLFQTLQRRDVTENTGIGLAVVRKIVEGRGGKAWVESEVGSGATFFVTWPL